MKPTFCQNHRKLHRYVLPICLLTYIWIWAASGLQSDINTNYLYIKLSLFRRPRRDCRRASWPRACTWGPVGRGGRGRPHRQQGHYCKISQLTHVNGQCGFWTNCSHGWRIRVVRYIHILRKHLFKGEGCQSFPNVEILQNLSISVEMSKGHENGYMKLSHCPK